MQTFLPHPNYGQSAAALDNKRLGKQRVENLQIAVALLEGLGWIHHPATKMWRGYEGALWTYHATIASEWIARGFADTTWDTMDALMLSHEIAGPSDDPWWRGSAPFHRAHKSNLKRKMPEHYAPQWPYTPDNLEYLWPGGADREGDWFISKPGQQRIARGELFDPRRA